MQTIPNCSPNLIVEAAQVLKDGHLVAFPTETVYGLGADATNKSAVNKIFLAKGRPKNHPLIVHISSMNRLYDWAVDIPEYAIKLANNFWPGPMTLILSRNLSVGDFITGGQSNVGLRVPDHHIAYQLLIEFEKLGGLGIAAPSANRFGSVSPTNIQAVQDELENYLTQFDLLLNGGQCDIGVESTIIDCTGNKPNILRPGSVTLDMVSTCTDLKIDSVIQLKTIRFPGGLSSHYAPQAKIVLDQLPQPGDGFLALAEIQTPLGCIRLASPTSANEFARVLYSSFRLADQKRIKKVIVVPPTDQGISIAIRDRLEKASAK